MNPGERETAEGFLYTDEYQLTMAQLYFRMGLHEKEGQFDHFFRSYPDYGIHQAGYCITAGLEWLVDWMQSVRCRDEDIAYLKSQTNSSGGRIFADDFLDWLRENGTFEAINLQAIPEGRVVHPNVPLTVVQGPLAIAQILETSLLNRINYQTLIATKAARIKESGRGKIMLEFGLRRGQDKGANAGARAALIGGADFTSNVGLNLHLFRETQCVRFSTPLYCQSGCERNRLTGRDRLTLPAGRHDATFLRQRPACSKYGLFHISSSCPGRIDTLRTDLPP